MTTMSTNALRFLRNETDKFLFFIEFNFVFFFKFFFSLFCLSFFYRIEWKLFLQLLIFTSVIFISPKFSSNWLFSVVFLSIFSWNFVSIFTIVGKLFYKNTGLEKSLVKLTIFACLIWLNWFSFCCPVLITKNEQKQLQMSILFRFSIDKKTICQSCDEKQKTIFIVFNRIWCLLLCYVAIPMNFDRNHHHRRQRHRISFTTGAAVAAVHVSHNVLNVLRFHRLHLMIEHFR